MSNTEMIIFVLYLAMMLGVGIVFFFRSKGSGEKDYFLGGRQHFFI